MGSTPPVGQVYSSANLPDFVVLEQYYLDRYALVYNVNRIASSSAYTPSTGPINVGVNNPSYGLTGITSPVWGSTHSEQLKALWRSTRGEYSFFVYYLSSLLLLGTFTSASQLSVFVMESKRFGTDLDKYLKGLGQVAIIYGSFIISVIELTVVELELLLPSLTTKALIIKRNAPNGTRIYGFNPSTNVYTI